MNVLRVLTIFSLFVPAVLFSQHPEDMNNAGVELMDDLKFAEALAFFNQAIEKDSVTTIYRFNRAIALTHLEKYRETIAEYQFLTSKVEDEPQYFSQLGTLYNKVNDSEQSIKYYSKAIELDGTTYSDYFQRGTLYLKKNDFVLAVSDFSEALKLNSESHYALHNRGIAFFKLGQTDKACQDWCAARIKGNPYSGSHLEINCKVSAKYCLPKE